MGDDIRLVMRFERKWFQDAVDAGKLINVSMLPATHDDIWRLKSATEAP